MHLQGTFCPECEDGWFLRNVDNWLPYLTVVNLEDLGVDTNTLINIYI
jgi:hypothetical protein